MKSQLRNLIAVGYLSGSLAGNAADPGLDPKLLKGSILDIPTPPLSTKTLPRLVDSFDVDNDGVADVIIGRNKQPAISFFNDVSILNFDLKDGIARPVQLISELIDRNYGPFDPLTIQGQKELTLSGKSLQKSGSELKHIKERITQGQSLLDEAKDALKYSVNFDEFKKRVRDFLGNKKVSDLKLLSSLQQEIESLTKAAKLKTKEVEAIELKTAGGRLRPLGHDVNDFVGHTVCLDRAALMATSLRSHNINAACIAFPEHVAVLLPDYKLIIMGGNIIRKYSIDSSKDPTAAPSITVEGYHSTVVDGIEGLSSFPAGVGGKYGEQLQRAKNNAIRAILKGEKPQENPPLPFISENFGR